MVNETWAYCTHSHSNCFHIPNMPKSVMQTIQKHDVYFDFSNWKLGDSTKFCSHRPVRNKLNFLAIIFPFYFAHPWLMFPRSMIFCVLLTPLIHKHPPRFTQQCECCSWKNGHIVCDEGCRTGSAMTTKIGKAESDNLSKRLLHYGCKQDSGTRHRWITTPGGNPMAAESLTINYYQPIVAHTVLLESFY